MDPGNRPSTPPVPHSPRGQAKRALRAGLATLLLTVPGSSLATRLLDVRWSREWWLTTAALAVQAVVTAGVLWAWRFRELQRPVRHRRPSIVELVWWKLRNG